MRSSSAVKIKPHVVISVRILKANEFSSVAFSLLYPPYLKAPNVGVTMLVGERVWIDCVCFTGTVFCRLIAGIICVFRYLCMVSCLWHVSRILCF